MPQLPQSLTISELARRWQVSRDRVREMVHAGKLHGAFVLPSAGRYGASIKVPLQSVIEAEARWQIGASLNDPVKSERRKPAPTLHLQHFPELLAATEPAAEYPAIEPHSSEHSA